VARYAVIFYEDENKRIPFKQFLKGLGQTKELAMLAAIEQILAEQGPAVCRSSWGKQLGNGLFEFRVRHTRGEIQRMFGGDPSAGGKEGPPGKVLLRRLVTPMATRSCCSSAGTTRAKTPRHDANSGNRHCPQASAGVPGGPEGDREAAEEEVVRTSSCDR
jgi:hypothetical protein